MTDNAAVLQQRVTKASNPFLSTLSAPGESQFLTVLKPCGILMPHWHLRANEFYSVIFGARPHARPRRCKWEVMLQIIRLTLFFTSCCFSEGLCLPVRQRDVQRHVRCATTVDGQSCSRT